MTTGRVDGLNSARAVADWLRRELTSGRMEDHHAARVVARETDRWFKLSLPAAEVAVLAETPEPTGDPRWDAMLEGVVAFRLHAHDLPAPAWTRRTSLEQGWDVYADVVTHPAHQAMAVMQTPAELLEKGVILPVTALELI